MLGDGTSGLSPQMANFYASVQALSTDPLSSAARQALLSGGESLASQFHGMQGQLTTAMDAVNSGITSSVQVINTAAAQISSLNDTISRAVSAGETPNDLLDQRDKVLADLSKQIQVSVVDDGKSGFNVFIGSGQPLVVGTKTYQLVAQGSASDPGKIEVAYQENGSTHSLPENSVTGGELGGLLSFRSKSLDNVQNSLGRIAIVLADTFNSQNKLGLDQDGQQGGDIFNVGSPVVTSNSANTSKAAVAANITDAKALTTSDYKLSYDGNQFSVLRISDGAITNYSSLPQSVDGVTFSMSGPAPAAGDSFLIKPTAKGAEQFSVKTSDVRSIATASPVVGGVNVANTGSASLGPVTVAPAYFSSPLTSPVSLSIANGAAPGTKIITGFPDGSSQVFTSGASISYGGISFSISGSPAVGDTFTLKAGGAESKDSRNANLLAGLQTSNLVAGSTTLGGSYAELTSIVGNKTRELQSLDSANTQILSQATAAQQSVSGVNLDEEAANLIKYQQAYQAAAKVMQTASSMFESLLSITGGA
jgi:flagellar hook-associated protein 1 FlgK